MHPDCGRPYCPLYCVAPEELSQILTMADKGGGKGTVKGVDNVDSMNAFLAMIGGNPLPASHFDRPLPIVQSLGGDEEKGSGAKVSHRPLSF